MKAFLAVLTILLVAGTSHGDTPTGIDEAFGATIVFTYDDGRTSELWLTADHKFTLDSRAPHHYRGAWVVRGQELCLKGSGLARLFSAHCYTIPPPPLGLHDPNWTQLMPVGGVAHVKLVQGHFAPGGQ
jgi:hypothetical protein